MGRKDAITVASKKISTPHRCIHIKFLFIKLTFLFNNFLLTRRIKTFEMEQKLETKQILLISFYIMTQTSCSSMIASASFVFILKFKKKID